MEFASVKTHISPRAEGTTLLRHAVLPNRGKTARVTRRSFMEETISSVLSVDPSETTMMSRPASG